MTADAQPLTLLLNRMDGGDRAAEQELAPLLHVELSKLAGRFMEDQRDGHTLQATALVHEAWMRLVPPREGSWANRAQFFRMASRVMRSVLVDHARARRAAKRGGDRERIDLAPEHEPIAAEPEEVYLGLDDALAELAERDRSLAETAELHLFGGLKCPEIARLLERPTKEIERAWRTARACLRARLAPRLRLET